MAKFHLSNLWVPWYLTNAQKGPENYWSPSHRISGRDFPCTTETSHYFHQCGLDARSPWLVEHRDYEEQRKLIDNLCSFPLPHCIRFSYQKEDPPSSWSSPCPEIRQGERNCLCAMHSLKMSWTRSSSSTAAAPAHFAKICNQINWNR